MCNTDRNGDDDEDEDTSTTIRHSGDTNERIYMYFDWSMVCNQYILNFLKYSCIFYISYRWI